MSNKEFQLSGHVSYSIKIKYKWLTEPGACKTCLAMHGKIYDKDKVPKKPHPNCRCHVEEISIIDPEISEAYKYREELEQLMKQAQKIFGDTNYCKAEIEKVIKDAPNNKTKQEAELIKQKLQELSKDLQDFINWCNNQGNTLNRSIIIQRQQMLKNFIEVITILNNKIEEWKLKALKTAQDIAVQALSPLGKDAAALWQIASSKFTKGLDYIKQNGYIVKDINDLNDEKLIKEVKAKIETQLHKSNTKGIVFKEDSSLAESIVNSKEFNKFVEDHIYELCVEDKVIDSHLEFLSDINNLAALRKARVIDVYVKKGFLYATVIDTLDYNSKDWTVWVPRILQENNMLEGYYHVTKISVPISKWLPIK